MQDDDVHHEDYDPARELDPVKLQAEAVRLQREGIEMMRAAQEEAKKRGAATPVDLFALAPPIKVPTFEECSASLRKAWEEVQKIMPDAPDAVKSQAFQVLLHGYAVAIG